jgi:hypothetical protein
MSTYTSSRRRLSAQLTTQVRQQLNINLSNSELIKAAQASLTFARTECDALDQALSAWDPDVTQAVNTLAPDAIAEARAIIDSAKPTTAADLAQAKRQLANALAASHRQIDAALHETVTKAIVEGSVGLGYQVTVCAQPDGATAFDLRRNHEILVAVVSEDGRVQADHAGLSDTICLQRHSAWVTAIANHGVEFVDDQSENHFRKGGGQLIQYAVRANPRALTEPEAMVRTVARQAGSAPTAPRPRGNQLFERSGTNDDLGETAGRVR